MKSKKIVSALLTLVMLLSFVPTFNLTAFAGDNSVPETICNINLSETLSDSDNYYVYNNRILLINPTVVYVLSGTTDKNIVFDSEPEYCESQTYYVRFNNVSIGDIVQGDRSELSANIDILENTVNNVKRMRLSNAEITGKGTLNAEDTLIKEGEKLSISDAKVNVTVVDEQKRLCWDGKIEIGGSACVTFKGNGVYDPLVLGNDIQNNTPAELTLKDKAKFYVLQDNMDVESKALVEGLSAYNNTKIVLQDNSYLEVEGKAGKTEDEDRACGIAVYGSLTVKDNATLKATAYGQAIYTLGQPFVIQGGKIIAESKESHAINAWYADLNISNATIDVTSKRFGIFSDCNINITNSKVTVKSSESATVFGRDKLRIENAYIDAETSSASTMAMGAQNDVSVQNSLLKINGGYGLATNNGKLNISGSWLENHAIDFNADTVANSVVFQENVGQVYGEHTIPFDAKVTEEMKLTISENTKLTVPDKKTFTNNGNITLNGSFVKNEGGTVICTSHTGGTATCIKAKCGICGAEYGDADSTNHVNLKHFEAKKATTAEKGNIEYWYCEDCGKYFSDENCINEITQEETVVKKLSSGGSSSTRYTVKFNTNGGNTITSQTVKKNGTATEPKKPTKDGYIFDGWYIDNKFTTEYDFDTKVTKNITLYAKWVEDEVQEPGDDNKPTPNEWKNPFTDVKKSDWFFDDVKYANENGLMSGITNSTFAPNENITRGMFVTVLYRVEGGPAVNKSIPFADVKANMYYANAVIWAEQNDIVKGYSETEFVPDENITREQIATILYRYAKFKGYDVTQGGMQIREYEDFESISNYAINAMTWAVNTGLMKGKTNTTLNPKDNATRAEIAAILNRFIESNK